MSQRDTDVLIDHARKMRDEMKEFCRRVEIGEVQSTKTYKKFKRILGDYESSK